MSRFHNHIVAAILAGIFSASPAMAVDQTKLDSLFSRLSMAEDAGEGGRIEAEILIESSKSGSPAMDLLLQRGSDALDLGDSRTAAEHFTALIDHDPAFAAAWNARAAAYYLSGEIGPALADLEQALTLEPRDFSALAGLAVILEESELKEKALAAYRASAEIHPWQAEVNEAIARLERELEGQDL